MKRKSLSWYARLYLGVSKTPAGAISRTLWRRLLAKAVKERKRIDRGLAPLPRELSGLVPNK